MIDTLNTAADGWLNWMWPMFWQVSVLIVLMAVVDWIIGKRVWPQVRYALWVLLLVKLITPPWLALPTSMTATIAPPAMTEVRVAPTPAEVVPPAIEAVVPALPSPADGTADMAEPVKASAPAVADASMTWRAWAMCVWAVGVAGLGAWLAVRLSRLRTAYGSPTPADQLDRRLARLLRSAADRVGLKRLPAVVVTDRLASPAVFGAVRPVLLLGADEVEQMPDEELEHVLLHELAHIKRGDLLVHGFNMLLQVAYWFHPLLWLVGRKLHHLRELCCDATVGALLRDASDQYARTLRAAAGRLLARSTPPGMGLLGLFEGPSRLAQRLHWLSRPSWKRPRLRAAIIAVVVAVMALGILPMARGKETRPAAEPLPAEFSHAKEPVAVRANETVPVNVRVLDENGEPVEGAKIRLLKGRAESFGWGISSAEDVAVTNTQGAFSLELDRIAPDRRVVLVAHKPGYALAYRDIQGPRRSDIRGTLTLRKPGRLGGVVVDEQGALIAGAEVIGVLDHPKKGQQFLWGFNVPQLRARTGPDGRFAFDAIPADVTVDFIVTAAGKEKTVTISPKVLQHGEFQYAPNRTDIKVVMADEAPLAGQVVEEHTGKPVAGIGIVAELNGGEGMPMVYTQKATSDAHGRFRFTGLGEHKSENENGYALLLEKPQPEWTAPLVLVEPSAGQAVADVQFPVTRGGTIEVAVRDEEGQPIAGARVSVSKAGSTKWSRIAPVLTDSEGIGRIQVLPGEYRLSDVDMRCYRFFRMNRNSVISVASSATVRQDVTLQKPKHIRGVVLDPDGASAENVTVSIWPGHRISTSTNTKGEFVLKEQMFQHPIGTILIARDFQRNLAALIEWDRSEEESEISLAPAATLVGKVVTPDGKPVTDAKVFPHLLVNHTGAEFDRRISLNDEGEYRIPAVPTGREFYVLVQGEAFGTVRSKIITPDGSKELVQMETLTIPKTDQVVAGVVVDGEGEPMPNLKICSTGRDQPSKSVTTDSKGRFRIEGLHPGKAMLQVWQGREATHFMTEAGRTDVRIQIGVDLSDGF